MNYDFLKDLSVENMMNHAKKISSWERLSGSSEELEAFQYMEQMYHSFGYETELVFHDAYISLPVGSRLVVNDEEIPSQTHSMVPSTQKGGVEGEIIYFSDKEIEKQTEGALSGKILAVDGRAVFKRVLQARYLGAVGLICIQEEPVRECIPSAAWGSPDSYCKGLYSDIPIVSIGNQKGSLLKERGLVLKGKIETCVDTGWRKIPSLTATLRAEKETEEFVMFTGHLDSWYFGAIDNGTVNAAQLEIARIVALNQKKLKRKFKVVNFSGHSHGRYAGSAWYADKHWLELHEHCVININGDSIGGKNATDITRSLIMPETKEMAVRIIKDLTGEVFEGSRCRRVADQSFWNCGVSSAFASFSKQPLILQEDGKRSVGKGNADLGWWWHTPEDTMENVDPEHFKRDASIFCSYIMAFLTEEVLPLDFSKTAEKILQELRTWQEKAGDRADLSREIFLAEKLLFKMKKNPFQGEKDDKRRLKMGRILVPLLNTTGNLYRNDEAKEFPWIPSLMVLDKIVRTKQGSEEEKQLYVELQQKQNYVAHSLWNAIELLSGKELYERKAD